MVLVKFAFLLQGSLKQKRQLVAYTRKEFVARSLQRNAQLAAAVCSQPGAEAGGAAALLETDA